MTNFSSLWQQARLRYGLRWARSYPDPSVAYRFLFRTVMVSAVVVMVATNADLAARAQQMEAQAEAATKAANIYASYKTVLRNCENGATGYVVGDRAYLCEVTKVYP